MNPNIAVAATCLVLFVLVAIFALIYVAASRYRKVGPNQALIVYGRGGTQIVRGGGKIIWPVVQTYRELSLELMSFDVAPQQDFYTNQGVAVRVEAVAQIKVRSDDESIKTAAEQFLTKTQSEREGLVRLVMEGHLRGIVGLLRVEEIVKEPEGVAEKVRNTVADDLTKMGLEVVSFTIKEVRDNNAYIENMGKPDIARIKRAADIAAAEAERDTAIRRAETMRESSVAKATADQERVIAETASQTRQAEAQRDLALKRAEYEATVRSQQAKADKAYDIEANVQQQQVVAEQVRIQRVEKEENVKVQEMEILRREKELIATVVKAADVERQRIATLADAERQRIEAMAAAEQRRLALEAEGRAEAARAEGNAKAAVTRVNGLAEAEIIRAKGQAEANAMDVKAQAFHEYNQAAILDKFLTNLPEVVRAMAEPLARVDKITIVSTGDGHGSHSLGASQLTGDIAKMIAQTPALLEALAGIKVEDLMKAVPGLRDHGAPANGDGASSTAVVPLPGDKDAPPQWREGNGNK